MNATEPKGTSGAGPACPFCNSDQGAEVWGTLFQGRRWTLRRCRCCRLRFTDPRPALADLEQFYSRAYHSQLCAPGAAERIFGPKFARYRDWIRHFLPAGQTLDVGCSTGLFPHLLREVGYEAEGLELNPNSAAWGRAHFGIPIRTLAIESGSYAAESYDLVSLTDVLEHTIHPLTSLRAVHRIVRAGGFVLVTFPDITSVESIYYGALARLFHRQWLWITCHAPLHTWEFTRHTAAAMFRAAGFEIAGFRRSQPWPVQRDPASLRLLSLPLVALSLPGIRAACGTQMEFMLRRPQRKGA